MQQLTPELQACMDECLQCHMTCLSTAMTLCLEAGGSCEASCRKVAA